MVDRESSLKPLLGIQAGDAEAALGLSPGLHRPAGGRRALTTVLLLALPAVVFAGAWRLGGVSALEDDLIYYLPIQQYIGERIRAGEFPLWNPLSAMGSPIAADPQAGLWYPPTWLFAAMPPLWAYPVTLVLHFALAGAGMYLFLRACRHKWPAALLGALAFEFAGFLIAHRAHLTILEATAWLPWLFYAWRRFADRGTYRYFALAACVLGLQSLVQHVQITIIGATLLTAWVVVVLWPRRPGLAWQYPLGMAVGGMLAGIQVIPTLFYFSGSIRTTPAYHLFIENSWWPGSAILMFFPMIMGARTPNLLDQPWWGMSHFCEQSAYASIVVLALALSSFALIRRRPTGSRQYYDREVIFWWVALAITLLIALGQYGPLAERMFHLPLYRSLRVPARWILIWSFALPVLASATASAILAGGDEGRRVARAVRRVALGVIPAVVLLALLVMAAARWRIDDLVAQYPSEWFAPFWAGLRMAIRHSNPALWLPVLLTVLTAIIATVWSRKATRVRTAALIVLMLADLASVAARVDVDVRTYRRVDLESTPPLAQAIRECNPAPGDRLLVPRFSANYEKPLEVLWPQSNLRDGVATFNTYGPLWPAGHRLLFHFMPWGSSETILSLLNAPDLCRAMGLRFVAVRSDEERRALETTTWPRTGANAEPIPETTGMRAVRAGTDLLWPIRIDRPGLYELSFEAEPGRDNAQRSFVRIENTAGQGITRTISIEPADLATGRRRLRFLFRCDAASGQAQVRVKAERGWAMSVSLATFACVAAEGQPATAPASPAGPFVHRHHLTGGIDLYELPGSMPLARWAKRAEPVADLAAAVDLLQNRPAQIDLPAGVVIEWPGPSGPPATGDGPLDVHRLSGHEVQINVNSPADGLLVLNESYDPGWRSWVDGRPTSVFRVNALLQGVVVPSGNHAVRFVYRPAGLRAGCALTLAGILTLILGGWATRRIATT